ncbi:MAG: hypothetical protein QNJ37_03865 [Crocosphaera sp.]|nr:hypothetical protein [Crocosphaera sp.]
MRSAILNIDVFKNENINYTVLISVDAQAFFESIPLVADLWDNIE